MDDTRTRRNWDTEDLYWRDNFKTRPYAGGDAIYDDYGPAYSYGVDSYTRHDGRPWHDVEPDLSRDWDQFKGKSRLTWEHAKAAVRDAWNRMTD